MWAMIEKSRMLPAGALTAPMMGVRACKRRWASGIRTLAPRRDRPHCGGQDPVKAAGPGPVAEIVLSRSIAATRKSGQDVPVTSARRVVYRRLPRRRAGRWTWSGRLEVFADGRATVHHGGYAAGSGGRLGGRRRSRPSSGLSRARRPAAPSGDPRADRHAGGGRRAQACPRALAGRAAWSGGSRDAARALAARDVRVHRGLPPGPGRTAGGAPGDDSLGVRRPAPGNSTHRCGSSPTASSCATARSGPRLA